jgi:hypothetical protein
MEPRGVGSGEAVGDLIRDHDGNIVLTCETSEEDAGGGELCAAVGQGFRTAFALATLVELGAVVSGDGVDDEQRDVVLPDRDGDLIAEDVVLGFQVVDVGAVDAAERRTASRRQVGESRVRLQDLRQTFGLQGSFGGDV